MRTIIGRLTFLVGVGFSICCVPATPVPSRAPELPPLAGPFVSVLAQSQWMAGSFRDEFDGSITWGASQSGQDMELSVSISCSSGVLGVSLIPGPAADWRVFAHGRVDFRFDDGEPRSEVFADEDEPDVDRAIRLGRGAAPGTRPSRTAPADGVPHQPRPSSSPRGSCRRRPARSRTDRSSMRATACPRATGSRGSEVRRCGAR